MTPSGRRIAVIEAMRGIASIAVACFHLSLPFSSALPATLKAYGWLGVDVFFVISGFVIPLSLYGRSYEVRNFPNFLLRRLVRLEPPYIASLLLTIALWHLSALAPGFGGKEPDYTLAQLGFHLFYLIPLTSHGWLGANYWSLAYEFVFYIVVGLAFPFLIARRVEFTAAAIAAAAAAFYYLYQGPVLDGIFLSRIVEFGVGILLMRLVVDGDGRRAVANWFWLAACLLAVFYLGGFVIGLVVFLSACAIFLLKDLELGRWAYFIGGFSYSLYLTHTIIGARIAHLGARFAEGAFQEIAVVAVALAGTVAFAIAFEYAIETPAKQAARRFA